LDEVLDVLALGDVQRAELRRVALGADLVHDLLQPVGASRAEHDLGAQLRQVPGRRFADAPCSPR